MKYFLVLAYIRANSVAQHPNHTWQAWRNRFLKTLDKRSEEWKQHFTSQAQVLLGGSNGQGKAVTKRARSNEPGDEHNTPNNKKKRVNDSSRESTEEESASDTNSSSSFRTGSLQAQG